MIPAMRLLAGNERDQVLQSKAYVRMRMNPEEKTYNYYGRKKYRWISMGFMEPTHWNPEGTDSPVIIMSTTSLKLILISAEPMEEQEEATMMTIDITKAFTQSIPFGPDDEKT